MAALIDIVTKGSTDRSVTLRIVDATDGTPETGVAYNTAGIDLWYRREGAAVVSATEADLIALTAGHTDWGFKHISHGEYRFDLPDAAFATGANYVDVGGTVTGMVVIGGRVRLTDLDLETAADNATLMASYADALLNRDMSAVTVSNTRSPINALRFLRNKWSISGTTLTVTEEDDSTTAFTITLTTNAAADPITAADPTT